MDQVFANIKGITSTKDAIKIIENADTKFLSGI